MFPIRSVTLAAILEPGAVCDLAGGASVAAALTCASALQTKVVRLRFVIECLHSCKGVAETEVLTFTSCKVGDTDVISSHAFGHAGSIFD